MLKTQTNVTARSIFLGLWVLIAIYIFYRYSVTGLQKEGFYGIICCAMIVLNIFQLRTAIKLKKEKEDREINELGKN